VGNEYLTGDRSLPEDLRDVLGGLSSGDVQNLTVSALLGGLMGRADGAGKKKLEALAKKAKDLGIDDLKLS
jgi:hypothetical protein